MVDCVATNEGLEIALAFTQRMPDDELQTIWKGQFWERRATVGALPLGHARATSILCLAGFLLILFLCSPQKGRGPSIQKVHKSLEILLMDIFHLRNAAHPGDVDLDLGIRF